MKILGISGWIFPDAEGGSFRSVYETSKRLAALGHDVTVLTQRLSRRAAARETLDGFRVIRYPSLKRNTFFFFTSVIAAVFFRTLIFRRRFDIVDGHHLVPVVGFCLANTIAPRPFVYHLYMLRFLEFDDKERYRDSRRSSWVQRIQSWMLRRMEGFVMSRARKIIVYSRFVQDLVKQYYPRLHDQTILLPPGVDQSHFQPADKTVVRRSLGLDEGLFYLFCVRRLEPRMGVENLLEAMRQVKGRFAFVRLVIAGRGSLDSVLKDRALKLDVNDIVEFKGWVPEDRLVQWYQAADLFVLPTRALEGFGLVTLESLACGTPVIGTPAGATPEILKPLGKELLFRDESPEAIAGGVCDWVGGKVRNLDIQRICRRYVEVNYTWEPHILRLEGVLNEVR